MRLFPELTSRQEEILALVVEDLPVKQIADRLGITERTTLNILSNAYARSGMHRASLAREYGRRESWRG